MALAVKYKTQVLSRLVASYTDEFVKLLADTDYKALSPSDQIAAQFELNHWYQRWFGMVPEPSKCSVDADDYTDVPIGTPHATYNFRDGIVSFFTENTPFGSFQGQFPYPDRGPPFVVHDKTPHPSPM